MNRRSIRIERLEIRLKGVAPQVARTAAGQLGHELLGQLGELPRSSGLQPAARMVNIDSLDAGTLRLPRAASSPGELRQLIARSVAATIRSKIQ